ncbi:hypothetical protein AB0B88_23660 [Micromonospora haikouensis]|uniref:hypothetical protein n=1 Tax=Micromonospora haikouensis TaxID=686309 RepID=UPI0033F84B7D
MATLKHSRGKFFHTHKMPPDRSFWRYFHDTVESQTGISLVSKSGNRFTFADWKPERSNCEQLTFVLEGLTLNLLDDWKALARNLFVGRILDGEINAKAWSEKQAGIVEITLQYTHVLGAYAATYNEYYQSIRGLMEVLTKVESDDDVVAALTARLERPWKEIRNQQDQWKDPKLIYGGCASLFSWVDPSRLPLVEEMVLSAEAFAVAHELSHHLLGHTNTKREKSSARRVLHEAVRATSIPQIMLPMNPSQRQEIEADALAFLICANALRGTPTFPEIYNALAGSALALIAAAHLNDDWIPDEIAPSHPAFFDRMQVIAEMTTLTTAGRPEDNELGHPLGFLAQLQTFAGLALNAFLHQNDPENYRRVNLLDVASHLTELADKLELPGAEDDA